MNIYIGIDPGESGGMVALNQDGVVLSQCRFTNHTKQEISDTLRGLTLDIFDNDNIVKCYFEKVHSMPKQGVSSTFKFGFNAGFIDGLLVAHRIPYEEVTPQKWQAYLSCRSKGDKKMLQQKAQQLFPQHKITKDIADAFLIAEYGRRVELGIK